MTDEFVWSVRAMRAYPTFGGQANVVCEVDWQLTALGADGLSEAAYGTASVAPAQGAGGPAGGFVPYEQLAESDVLAWVAARVDEPGLRAALAAGLARRREVKTSPLPWAAHQPVEE